MKKLALICGSFNPFTIGHLNIVEKSEKIFGEGNVIIAIGINPEKTGQEGIEKALKRAEYISSKIKRNVEVYNTFLHEYIEKKESDGYDIVLVRGLRNSNDLEYENTQLRFINDFKKNINVVFIKCDDEFQHISSSAIRNLESFRSGSGNKYIV